MVLSRSLCAGRRGLLSDPGVVHRWHGQDVFSVIRVEEGEQPLFAIHVLCSYELSCCQSFHGRFTIILPADRKGKVSEEREEANRTETRMRLRSAFDPALNFPTPKSSKAYRDPSNAELYKMTQDRSRLAVLVENLCAETRRSPLPKRPTPGASCHSCPPGPNRQGRTSWYHSFTARESHGPRHL